MLLVTGITGHSGRYFLQELIQNKYKGTIRCVVRSTSNISILENSGLNIEIVIGDLNNPAFIERVMEDVDTVMHIYNIHHSPIIVKSAIKKNAKRVILVHTTGIYSKFKYASEEYKQIEQTINKITVDPDCPLSITILRPSMIYGDICDSNMSKFIKILDKVRILPVIDGGESLIQPVNARDLGKAYFTVLMSPEETVGKTYDLTGAEPIKMINVFKSISKELNKKTSFISVPLNFAVTFATVLKKVSFTKIDLVEKIQRMGENRSYSHDKATRDFGFDPMPFEEGIKMEVEEYKEYIHKLKKHK